MLKVSIDLVPYGNEAKRSTLQSLEISNIGGTPERGRYLCRLLDKSGNQVRTTHIQGWPRLERDAAALVAEALYQLGYGGKR